MPQQQLDYETPASISRRELAQMCIAAGVGAGIFVATVVIEKMYANILRDHYWMGKLLFPYSWLGGDLLRIFSQSAVPVVGNLGGFLAFIQFPLYGVALVARRRRQFVPWLAFVHAVVAGVVLLLPPW